EAWSRTSRVLEAVIGKVERFGGRVAELTPTKLVAAFGLEPAEDAPRRAAHVALAIQKSVERERVEAPPDVAIGLHVAPLLIGRIGSRTEIAAATKRAEWPVLDQLLRACEPGEAIISPAAAAFLEPRFE